VRALSEESREPRGLTARARGLTAREREFDVELGRGGGGGGNEEAEAAFTADAGPVGTRSTLIVAVVFADPEIAAASDAAASDRRLATVEANAAALN
jgi:hypothetical protein